MGHIRLGTLPRTRSWEEVIALIQHGASARQIAQATIRAAEKALSRAPQDPGVTEAVWLLTQLPRAAKEDDFSAALARCGLHVSGQPTLMELAAAFSDAIDARLANNHGRTDLGEMAQMAAVESLVDVLSERTSSLFETTPDRLQTELGRLTGSRPFGILAEKFFGRLTFKCMDYYLSRATAQHVGPGRRLPTLARQAEFSRALELHCQEAARYVAEFSGVWTSKTAWQKGEISRKAVFDFTYGAMSKLTKELKLGGGIHGD